MGNEKIVATDELADTSSLRQSLGPLFIRLTDANNDWKFYIDCTRIILIDERDAGTKKKPQTISLLTVQDIDDVEVLESPEEIVRLIEAAKRGIYLPVKEPVSLYSPNSPLSGEHSSGGERPEWWEPPQLGVHKNRHSLDEGEPGKGL